MAVVSSTGICADAKTAFHRETRRSREPWVWNDKLVSAAGLTAMFRSKTPLLAMWRMNYIHVTLFVLLELAHDQPE